jgi:hypothetical protein
MKKEKEIKEEVIEEVVPETVEKEVFVNSEEESEAKKKFMETMELYKKQNPVKYAQKEPELLKKLSKM